MTDYTNYTQYIPDDNETDYPTKIENFIITVGTDLTTESDKTDTKAALVTPGSGSGDLNEVLIKSTAAGEITTSGAEIGANGAGHIVDTESVQDLKEKILDSSCSLNTPTITTPIIDVINDTPIGTTAEAAGVFSTLEATGNTNLQGDVLLGTNSTNTIEFIGDTVGHITPAVGSDWNLGGFGKEFTDFYMSGTAYIPNIEAITVGGSGATVDEISTSMGGVPGDTKVLTEKAISDHVAASSRGLIDVQIFTTSGANTWIKPTNAKLLEVWCVGGGGGGGYARVNYSGTSATLIFSGGGGGGSMAYSFLDMDSIGITTDVSVTVGGGGTGGQPFTTVPAVSGGESLFGSAGVHFVGASGGILGGSGDTSVSSITILSSGPNPSTHNSGDIIILGTLSSNGEYSETSTTFCSKNQIRFTLAKGGMAGGGFSPLSAIQNLHYDSLDPLIAILGPTGIGFGGGGGGAVIAKNGINTQNIINGIGGTGANGIVIVKSYG